MITLDIPGKYVLLIKSDLNFKSYQLTLTMAASKYLKKGNKSKHVFLHFTK